MLRDRASPHVGGIYSREYSVAYLFTPSSQPSEATVPPRSLGSFSGGRPDQSEERLRLPANQGSSSRTDSIRFPSAIRAGLAVEETSVPLKYERRPQQSHEISGSIHRALLRQL